jgi:MFS family permease
MSSMIYRENAYMNEAAVSRTRSLTPFARLAVSNLAAQMSEQIALVAIPMVAVTLFNAGGGTTSLMQMLNTLPFLLLAIPFGLLADRGARIGIMSAGEAVRTISIVTLFVLVASGHASLTLLALLGMIGSIGTVAYTVGAPTLVPDLVPSSGLSRANGQVELCRSLALAAGPALGGALVGQMEASTAFLIAIALSTIAFVLITLLPRVAARRHSTGHPLHQIREGARFVMHHEYLRPIVLTSVLFNTAWFCVQGIYVAYAITRLNLTTGQTGMTLALYGIGMIVGSQLANVLSRRFSFGVSIIIGPIFGATASIAMFATLIWPSMLLPSVAYLLLGMGPIIWTISTTTLRQLVTPPPMLGRVTALIVTSTAGFRPIGAGIGALTFVLGGYELVLVVSTFGFIAQAIVILRSPAARIDALPSADVAPLAVK